MKVSLYVRERGTRKQKKHNPKKSYPQDGSIIWVLRYGSTWETLDVKTLSEATSLRLRRQIELDGGWRPTTKVKEPTVLMLDKARDVYLAQIEKGRKPAVLSVGNLEAKRDFSDVRDIVRAYWLALEKCEAGEVYNICRGKAWSIREVLDLLLSMTKTKIEVKQDAARLRPSDVPILLGDNSKFVKATGWQPTIPFEQTLRDMLEYWRAR